MNIKAFYQLKYMSLKTKLGILTILLVGFVTLFAGYTVIRQQRETLLMQMRATGSFLVKNLAKNVVGPLLSKDSLSLSNLIASLEAREKAAGNPARFTAEEYRAFLARFLLENKMQALAAVLTRKDQNIYINAENIAQTLQAHKIGDLVLEDLLKLASVFTTQPQYETFFEQYSWARSILEPLVTKQGANATIRPEELGSELQRDLSAKCVQKIADEISNHVRNPFIGYAIVVDQDGIIQAHPDIDKFLGKPYLWPEGTTALAPAGKDGEEDLKEQRCLFEGEPHYDFAARVTVRDKNIGTAYIGMVHIGLREDYILRDIAEAKKNIIYITIIALMLGTGGAYMVAALIVKPIKALVHDAEILGGGDLDHPIQVSTYDEVGALAQTLDATRIKLQDAREKLIISERLARELEIAREIQMTLLPKEMPRLERVEIGTLYRAAAEVGGDLYDFFWVSEYELGIVVADVAGKGIPGSMMMTMAKAVIRAKAVRTEPPDHLLPVGPGGDAASVIRKANQMIAQDIKKGMFITANYGILNVETLTFQFVSAGHNDTLVYNSHTNELREYNPKGIALGLDRGKLFDKLLQAQELTLTSGDLLFQFTDGINEAMNERKEEFGEDRLKDAIRKYAHQSVDDFLRSLDQELRIFTEGYPQSDDITAVVVKVKE